MTTVSPLQGVRIVALTNVLAGPFCCQQLAHLGADVIKIENPQGGDLGRQLGADPELCKANMGSLFLGQNAGQRSITLDLKQPQDRERFIELVAGADGLVENFRPGVMARLGLDYEVLKQHNPKLVYCAISGFGQTGPLRGMPAFDQIVQGMSGLMSITGDVDSAPLRAGFPIADTVGGLTAAFALCSAFASREVQQGCFIDVSMMESMLASMGWIVSNFLIADHAPEALGNDNATGAPSGTFRTGSGLINIAAAQQTSFKTLCRVLGAEELLTDSRYTDRYTRIQNRQALTRQLEDVLARRSAEEWQQLICDAGIPAGCVYSVDEILSHSQVEERDLVQTYTGVSDVNHPVKVCGPGFLVDNQRPVAASGPPSLGQHNDTNISWRI